MECTGLDDLVILGFRFFSTLLGVRVASFPAAALRASDMYFVVAPRCLAGCVLLLLRSGALLVGSLLRNQRGWREVATTAFL